MPLATPSPTPIPIDPGFAQFFSPGAWLFNIAVGLAVAAILWVLTRFTKVGRASAKAIWKGIHWLFTIRLTTTARVERRIERALRADEGAKAGSDPFRVDRLGWRQGWSLVNQTEAAVTIRRLTFDTGFEVKHVILPRPLPPRHGMQIIGQLEGRLPEGVSPGDRLGVVVEWEDDHGDVRSVYVDFILA